MQTVETRTKRRRKRLRAHTHPSIHEASQCAINQANPTKPDFQMPPKLQQQIPSPQIRLLLIPSPPPPSLSLSRSLCVCRQPTFLTDKLEFALIATQSRSHLQQRTEKQEEMGYVSVETSPKQKQAANTHTTNHCKLNSQGMHSLSAPTIHTREAHN